MKLKTKKPNHKLFILLLLFITSSIVGHHPSQASGEPISDSKAFETNIPSDYLNSNPIKLLADITPPTIDLTTLIVNQSSAKPGDNVTIKIKVSDDDSGIKSVFFSLSNVNGSTLFEHVYAPDSNGYYLLNIPITENTHSGKWHLNYLLVTDNNSNTFTVNSDEDLMVADFIVESQADITPPTIDLTTLIVNQSFAKPGDNVSIKIKVSDDDSGIKSVFFSLSNVNGSTLFEHVYAPDSNGYYLLNIPITENTHSGKWHLNYLLVTDNNSNTFTVSSDEDLMVADFIVEEFTAPINQIKAEYLTINTTWNYKTIDRDVYVGPNAILTIDGDVKINGNLYILGGVISYGDLSVNEVHSRSIYYGYSSTVNQGSFNVKSGNHNISSLISTTYPIPSIPIEIYSSNKVDESGFLPLLEGATLPIADLYIDGVKTDYNYNGTFSIPNYEVGTKRTLEFKMVDVFGKSHFFTYYLDQGDRLPTPVIDTVAGLDRYKTAVQVSQAGFTSVDTVVLVRSDDFPDALSAGPLAYALNAPILLTKSDVLNSETQQELSRLKAKHIILLGGESAINNTVEIKLTALGYNVSRIQGANRFETSVAVGNRIVENNGSPDSIILTSSSSFADALSAGSYASKEGFPILLTNGTVMNPVNTSFLTTTGIKNILIVGGPAVVSNEVEIQLKNSGFNVTRISGSDRSATSAILAAEFFPKPTHAVIASGWSFADALSAAPYAAKLNAPILLLTKDPLNASVETYLSNTGIYNIKVIGGEAAISNAVKVNLLEIISK